MSLALLSAASPSIVLNTRRRLASFRSHNLQRHRWFSTFSCLLALHYLIQVVLFSTSALIDHLSLCLSPVYLTLQGHQVSLILFLRPFYSGLISHSSVMAPINWRLWFFFFFFFFFPPPALDSYTCGQTPGSPSWAASRRPPSWPPSPRINEHVKERR